MRELLQDWLDCVETEIFPVTAVRVDTVLTSMLERAKCAPDETWADVHRWTVALNDVLQYLACSTERTFRLREGMRMQRLMRLVRSHLALGQEHSARLEFENAIRVADYFSARVQNDVQNEVQNEYTGRRPGHEHARLASMPSCRASPGTHVYPASAHTWHSQRRV